jgi:hypothetical protein
MNRTIRWNREVADGPRHGRLVVVGDPPRGIGRIDCRGQRIEQPPEPAFTLPQRCLRPQGVYRHDIVDRRPWIKCGDRSLELAFQKSNGWVHVRGIPLRKTGSDRFIGWQSFDPQRQLGQGQKVAPCGASF